MHVHWVLSHMHVHWVLQLLKAIERSRGHAASFVPEDEEAIRKREVAGAVGTAALETASEYSADMPDTQPALRLAVRAKRAKNGDASPTKVDVGAEKPVRSVVEYQLTAAQMPPPFLACMQVRKAVPYCSSICQQLHPEHRCAPSTADTTSFE